jgi:hypothetical protein
VTRVNLKDGSITSKSYVGQGGYALAIIGIYQYPVVTLDHGEQWRIAGGYFNMVTTSGMGAGGTASNIVTISKSIAVAYHRGAIMGPVSDFYSTVDSGKQWYVTGFPGTVQRVAWWEGGSIASSVSVKAITALVVSRTHPTAKRTYRSTNGGKSWTLISTA